MSGDEPLAPIPLDPLTNDAAQLPVQLLALSKPTLRVLRQLQIRTLGDILTFDLSRLPEYELTRSEINRVRGELVPFKVDLGLGRQREEAQVTARVLAGCPEGKMLADVMPDFRRFRYTLQREPGWEIVGDNQLPPGNYFLFIESKDALQFADTLKPICEHYLESEEARNAVVVAGVKDGCYSVFVSNPLMKHLEPLLRIAGRPTQHAVESRSR